MRRQREKSMQMPQKSDGSSVLRHPERIAQQERSVRALGTSPQNTNGPGDCFAVEVQVTVIPKMVIWSEPP